MTIFWSKRFVLDTNRTDWSESVSSAFHSIKPPRSIGTENFLDIVPHPPEDGELLFFGAGGVGWIVEGPVVAVHLAGEHRAGLVGVAADGDDGFHLVIEKDVHVLRVVAGGFDADFLERADCERVDVSGGIRAGAFDAEIFAEGFSQDRFGKVGAAGVAGA